MNNFKYYKIVSSRVKQRNSYIFLFEGTIFIIDPALESIKDINNNIKMYTNFNIVILISHVHKSHYDGLEQLLGLLHTHKNIFIISPFHLKIDNTNNCSILVLNNSSEFTIKSTNSIIKIQSICGHCNKMLEVKVIDSSQNKIFLFASDNLTTNFMPPVTNEGGNINSIIKYYENTLKLLNQFEQICILPGHGNVQYSVDYLEKLLEYFNSLPNVDFCDIDKALIDDNAIHLAKSFHELNLSKVAKPTI